MSRVKRAGSVLNLDRNSLRLIFGILFEFSFAAYLIFSFQFSCHSLIKHSNFNIGWGPLRWLYLTPSFHASM